MKAFYISLFLLLSIVGLGQNPVFTNVEVSKLPQDDRSPEISLSNKHLGVLVSEENEIDFFAVRDLAFNPNQKLFFNFKVDWQVSRDLISYSRDFKKEEGILREQFGIDGAVFTKESFVSKNENLLIIHYTSDIEAGVSFLASLDSPISGTLLGFDNTHTFMLKGSFIDTLNRNQVWFSKGKIFIDGGAVFRQGQKLAVNNANTVTIMISLSDDNLESKNANFQDLKQVHLTAIPQKKEEKQVISEPPRSTLPVAESSSKIEEKKEALGAVNERDFRAFLVTEALNFGDGNEVYVEEIKRLSTAGKKKASEVYKKSGWVLDDGTGENLWLSGELSNLLWKRYLYSGDKAYLKMVYPIMKDAALFYENMLKSNANIARFSQRDFVVIGELFSNIGFASDVLRTDKIYARTLLQKREALKPLFINELGILTDSTSLYAVFPATQITQNTTPSLFTAARNTLMKHKDDNIEDAIYWARLLDGNKALELLGESKTSFDSDFAKSRSINEASVITEMLVQCTEGAVYFLPALPDVWASSGSVGGIRTLGGFEILNMEWKDGKVVKLSIKSDLGGNLRLRIPNRIYQTRGLTKIEFARGENPNPFFRASTTLPAEFSPKATILPYLGKNDQLFDIATQKGMTYNFEVR